MLQERQKWNHPRRNLTLDDLVLVVEENVPRGQWPLARVCQVRSDDQGIVRSAKVKTKDGELLRPITKLVLILEANG